MKYFTCLLIFIFTSVCASQSIEKKAKNKIKVLENLILKAEKKGIDVLKEKTTVRTAEVFLKFADWDEKHVSDNTISFKRVPSYKDKALKMAEELADFERNDVVLMLEDAITYLELLVKNKVFRKPSVNVDWSKVKVEEDQLTYKNMPVFLTDYTWKPNTKLLTEYHGNLDSFFLTPSYLITESGTINARIEHALNTKPDGTLGFVFMNHKNVPKWAKSKYGSQFSMREDTYTAYDIDHPGARIIQKKLLEKAIPKMAGKKYTELGYMLCNEPHFFTYTNEKKKKLPWASGSVSKFTIEKFKIWLKKQHKDIGVLNSLWHTNFQSFKNISINIPIDISLKGSPIWYDWSLFNMERVTNWYSFLKAEIVKHDPKAKVHLKIMPNLWTENERIHGIDLEALTDLSGIVGNDSGAQHKRIWGKPKAWEAHYAFDWRELCMAYDFMKSVSPNKINFNSELHYLSTVRSRNLYLDPKFARASFWLAHSYGMTASQIWYWPRAEDGSVSKKAKNDKGYAGSNNQQPRVTNEVAMTLIDLNTNSKAIMAMQRQKKSLRIFYSKTSAINKDNHMDDLFKLYKSLNFEGTPIGFVTQNIIQKQNNNSWGIVLGYKTPFVTEKEFNTIQTYLDSGGTVIKDEKSFLNNEYGNPLPKLKVGNGTLIELNSVLKIKEKALAILKSRNLLSDIEIIENNTTGTKGCIWKVVKNERGHYILSVVNVGKTEATLNIKLKGSNNLNCKDILKGVSVSSTPILKPLDVYFVEIID